MDSTVTLNFIQNPRRTRRDPKSKDCFDLLSSRRNTVNIERAIQMTILALKKKSYVYDVIPTSQIFNVFTFHKRT